MMEIAVSQSQQLFILKDILKHECFEFKNRSCYLVLVDNERLFHYFWNVVRAI